MSHPDPLYDDYDSFYEDDMELNDYEDEFDDIDDYYDDNSMDGDHESGLASAGFGMDEDYNSDTPMYDDYYGGE